jgi:hypothetical protein
MVELEEIELREKLETLVGPRVKPFSSLAVEGHTCRQNAQCRKDVRL